MILSFRFWLISANMFGNSMLLFNSAQKVRTSSSTCREIFTWSSAYYSVTTIHLSRCLAFVRTPLNVLPLNCHYLRCFNFLMCFFLSVPYPAAPVPGYNQGKRFNPFSLWFSLSVNAVNLFLFANLEIKEIEFLAARV